MPPLTPRTTCRSLIRPRRSDLRLELLEGQRVLVDLTQSHRERLLLHVGRDERADVLEKTLTELRVVGVDLPGALRRVDDERVLALDLVEQLVDGRVGDALGIGGGAGHALPLSRAFVIAVQATSQPARIRLTRCSAGPPTPGPDQPGGPPSGLLDRRVDDRRVELVLGRELDARGVEAGLDDLGGLGATATQATLELLPARWREEDEQGVRHELPHLPRALHLDLQEHGVAGGEAVLHRAARGAVPVAGVLRVLEQLAVAQHPTELLTVDEEPVESVDLAGARRPGRRAHGVPDVRIAIAEVGDDRTLADTCRTGEDGQP